ncbi:ogr/Delta-like zinc finger family protein [Serratia marcescens]|uniref:ogr/Delta-like zinc finger family protein n=1 Tax=Serratia TaxID=613 RepID=UPI000F7F0658|nr:ogr/Delta-like zinc finger family protein [Serratia marcescens]MDF8320534.1 ogr/Delta-like zinc finger family protein [Serratia nevei]ELY1861267.1 ogr/Delta-like zinc finger family protein [Serratia marcescens]MBN5322924.1 ogr/Delta-like zinc finger family protein [Serratia marcescens]MDF8326044.1 ogr/Delta-like zinc finger family protein [Serratia nevei]MDF8336500.1 ogr/Delta-like zinc finger family protein [Serratia nevei]
MVPRNINRAPFGSTTGSLSENTKERYHQCQNINCSCTFVTLESIQRQIVSPGNVDIAPPHPTRSNQGTLWI